VHKIHAINYRASVRSLVNQYQKSKDLSLCYYTFYNDERKSPCNFPILGMALIQLMGGITDVILCGTFSCLTNS
jgi:hypothetical protein